MRYSISQDRHADEPRGEPETGQWSCCVFVFVEQTAEDIAAVNCLAAGGVAPVGGAAVGVHAVSLLAPPDTHGRDGCGAALPGNQVRL
jgi:hypothetical protein